MTLEIEIVAKGTNGIDEGNKIRMIEEVCMVCGSRLYSCDCGWKGCYTEMNKQHTCPLCRATEFGEEE